MKAHFLSSIRLTLLLIILFALLFPLLVSGIALLAPDKGNGEKLKYQGRTVGYANIGQLFTRDAYFWSRPSAANYNAASSAGSNKAPSNAEYLQLVQSRIDTFIAHHPYVHKQDIPSEMVTASGSGLDPHISPQAAYLQAQRIAQNRHIPLEKIQALVAQHIEKPLLGLFGPAKVNVLQLNIALDQLTNNL